MKSVPKPSELTVPAGAEGWEALYPYHLVFRNAPARRTSKFWFCDSQHWPTVFKPFETIGGEFAVKCLGQYNTRHLLIPPANGIEFKIHLGYLYMSPVPLPPERDRRAGAGVRARAGHYFQNWDSLLDTVARKVRGDDRRDGGADLPRAARHGAVRGHRSRRAKDGTEVLMENYDRLIQLCYQHWQYHFEFLNLGYVAYLDFFGFCKQVFPGIPDQAIAKMVQGVDMELFRPDDELKKLAMLAVELGLRPPSLTPDDVDGTLARGRGRRRRRRWLGAYASRPGPVVQLHRRQRLLRAPTSTGCEHQEIPLGYIKDYIRAARGRRSEIDAAGRRSSPPSATGSSRSTATCSTARPARPFDAKLGPRRAPPTRTWRTTTSTSSTGRWACSGARSAS